MDTLAEGGGVLPAMSTKGTQKVRPLFIVIAYFLRNSTPSRATLPEDVSNKTAQKQG